MTPVKAQLRQGHPEKALEELDRGFGENENDLVYLMEKGLLLRYAGGFEESNAVFEEAEQLAEDLYTKSISKNLASFITSDKALPYEGEDFERIIINYFRAMNYLDLGLPEDALVECRKVEAKLQFYEQKYEGDKKYRKDPFIHYLTGLIHESSGEINDAYISYKKAEEAFSDLSDFLGVRGPKYIGGDLLRTASALGFSNEMEEIRREYPHSVRRDRIPDGKGEVVLFVEAGFVPMKTEVSLNLPILENEKDDEIEDLAYRMRGRARIDRDWDHVHYWLKVALPGYQPPAPSPWTGVEAEGESGSLVENLDTLARVSLEDRMPTVLLRALVRALAKYLASTKGEDAIADKHGDTAGAVFGALFNIAAVASERADLEGCLRWPMPGPQ